MKHLKRIAAIGLGQVVIFAAVLFALSGTQMGATELPTSSSTISSEITAPAVSDSSSTEAPPTEIALLDSVFDDTIFAGDFNGNGPFTVNGSALATADGIGQRRLVLTNDFQTNRGHELVVFLRSATGERVRISNLTAISGTQEYVIPGELNLATFNEVEIRDVVFDVHYGSAFLTPLGTS